jgi:hypothetical protein
MLVLIRAAPAYLLLNPCDLIAFVRNAITHNRRGVVNPAVHLGLLFVVRQIGAMDSKQLHQVVEGALIHHHTNPDRRSVSRAKSRAAS